MTAPSYRQQMDASLSGVTSATEMRRIAIQFARAVDDDVAEIRRTAALAHYGGQTIGALIDALSASVLSQTDINRLLVVIGEQTSATLDAMNKPLSAAERRYV